MSIAKNLQLVRQKIKAAANECGRDPHSVKLLAVSKTHPVTLILEAYQEGQRLFGENYVQESLEKIEKLSAQKMDWHFIGRLQSNKVKQVVGKFKLIHSVDRESLAKIISEKALAVGIVQPVLLQVNLADEGTKGGTSAAESVELAKKMMTLPGLSLEGLMAMPPIDAPAEISRGYFRKLKEILAEIRQNSSAEDLQRHTLNELSMGTSGDFKEAISEGATIVRIGTEIFGQRT